MKFGPSPEFVAIAGWVVAFPLAIAAPWIGYGWMWLPIFAGLLLGFALSSRR